MSAKRTAFPQELYGGLWHTTHPARFRQIRGLGAILPSPPIPDKDRWKTSQGPELYPYVRHLGGVSLFDFHEFNPVTYSDTYSMSNWRAFVPICQKWDEAVWIEIDRVAVADRLIPASTLVERWKSEEAYRHSIMPRIEAGYLGPVRLTTFRRAYLCTRERLEFQTIDHGAL